jgi:allantoinase
MKHLESRDWQSAWGGVSSLQLTLSIVWKAASDLYPSMPLQCLATWLAANPARLCGLSRKGKIAAGMDADLCVWDPNEEWIVVGADLYHRHKVTPYEGERLRGRVHRTYVRGNLVYDNGKFAEAPIGELLRRGT